MEDYADELGNSWCTDDDSEDELSDFDYDNDDDEY